MKDILNNYDEKTHRFRIYASKPTFRCEDWLVYRFVQERRGLDRRIQRSGRCDETVVPEEEGTYDIGTDTYVNMEITLPRNIDGSPMVG
jgi:hypothetical protein